MSTPIRRSDLAITKSWAYLDNAGVSPVPRPVAEAMCGWATGPGARGSLDFDRQSGRIEEVRALGARLMGVAPEEVAFVKNTTEGLGFVANGIEWSEGDRVVVPDGEFPSTIYPWLALEDRGVVVDRVEPAPPSGSLRLEAFADAISRGAPPKVVATSWVQYSKGWRSDLAALSALAHDVGALLCVDVIQGLGVVPSELGSWGCDFATADAHKWLLGPTGIGMLYVSRRCLDRLRPLEPGWASVAHREQWENLDLVFDDSARRFEGGSANACGVYGLGAALEMLAGAGAQEIWRHVSSLCDHATASLEGAGYEVLSDRSEEGRSGIVTFSVGAGRDAVAAVGSLKERSIACSARGGGIRISPHGYNDLEDIDRLVSAISQF
ncbi:MAG TPA: aminotransferase class V-fold PLP-dependent enzyme [Acidimicrobiales bacterium]|nr:aminotransferase class V-fold PLP-dependent enzyme [Acidimicrobiales bacterium]